MSQQERVDYAEGLQVALRLQALLAPSCERIEIAGSIRRRWPTVGDIELVAIPKRRYITTLWGETEEEKTHLDLHLEAYPEFYPMHSNGKRLKRLRFDGMPVDLFVTDPERWGVICTLRTGSADFSKWLVTSRDKGGARRVDRYVKDGRIWEIGVDQPLETPEEPYVFQALGVPWTPLEMRNKGYWQSDMATWQPIRETTGAMDG